MAFLGKGKGKGRGARKEASARKRGRDAAAKSPVPAGMSKRAAVLKAVVCLLILVLLCIPPVFVNNPVGYLPVLSYLFLLLILFLYVNITARFVVMGMASNMTSCPRNTDINFLLRFKNNGLLPCMRLSALFKVTDIFGNDDATTWLSISIAPKKTRDFNFPVRFAHLGECQVGIAQATISDPIGLFTRKLETPGLDTVEITPRLFNIDRSAIQSLELNETKESMTPFQKDGMDYMGVREYKRGDPMKSIHWKLSSRVIGMMYTKLYETSGTPGMEILLSTHAPDVSDDELRTLYDTSVEAAVSFHDFALNNNLRTELSFEGRDGERVRYGDEGRIDYRDLMRKLPLPSPNESPKAVADELHELSYRQDSPGNIVVLASYLPQECVVSMLEARSRGKQLLVVLITPSDVPPEARFEMNGIIQRLAQSGIHTVELCDSDEIEGLSFA